MGDSKYVTLEADGIPLRRKLAYACGIAAASAGPAAIGVLINPIFNIALGLSPAAIGITVFFQRIWDAMIDPFAGQLSDSSNSRWGRRKPLILVMALPMGAAFATIWLFPRNIDAGHLLGYLFISSIIFYSIHSLYTVPLVAFGMELTSDYHERTRLNTWAQCITLVSLVGVQWIFPFVQSFQNTINGVRCFALIGGGLLGGCAILPMFIRNAPARVHTLVVKRRSLIFHLKSVMANRPFVILLGTKAIFTFSYNIVSVLGLYLNYYYVYGGQIHKAAIMQGWNGTIFQIAGIAALFPLRWCAIVRGKQEALSAAIVIWAIGSIGKLFVYDPAYPFLQIFVYISNGIVGAAMAMLIDAMLADVADYDETLSGLRREGIFASGLAWTERISYSMGALFSGLILVGIGFDMHRGGNQAKGVLQVMQYTYAAIPFLGACISYWLLSRYPLSQRICYGIKLKLDYQKSLAVPCLQGSG